MAEKASRATIASIVRLRGSGLSIAAVAAKTDVSRVTVIKYTRGMNRGMCRCGKPGGHKGWCEHLFVEHPIALAKFRKIGDRTRKWTTEADEVLRAAWCGGKHREEIARSINAVLGRTDITGHSVVTRAHKLDCKRRIGPDGVRAYVDRYARAPRGASPVEIVRIKVPFCGLGTSGPDPFRAERRKQAIEGSKGRI